MSIELPAGLTVTPGGAAGLAACTDAQLGIGSNEEANCPASSRLGAIELVAPALRDPLIGSVYLGEERPGERFRLFVVAPGPGLVFKSIGALQPNPVTGRLAATLNDLPQAALARLSMSFDGGPNGLLASPLACGPAAATARFVPHGGGEPVLSSASVAVVPRLPGSTCPGPLPFAPQLTVASSTRRAGALTSLAAVLRRQGGEQLPRRFSLTLPAGLSAGLGTIEACPEAAASEARCPFASRVGSARAAVGSGPLPAQLDGQAYLAGSYRRAPFSIVIVFRATIGPFDMGHIAIRATVEVDARTGRLRVTTDSLPEVVEGVPIRFQAIELSLDRGSLLRNPTSCSAHRVEAAIEAQDGAAATASSPYPVRGCGRLRFKPRVQVALLGTERLRRGDGVGLRATARLRKRDANLRALRLSLPPAVELDLTQLGEICSRRDAIDGLCPDGSRVGAASARTPLLSRPLRGSVYVVQPRGDGQPDLWVRLEGGGLQLSVRGMTRSQDGRFVTQLAGLPDMPLAAFELRLGLDGEKKLLSLAAEPCAGDRPRAFVARFAAKAQNGAERRASPRIATGARCR